MGSVSDWLSNNITKSVLPSMDKELVVNIILPYDSYFDEPSAPREPNLGGIYSSNKLMFPYLKILLVKATPTLEHCGWIAVE